MSEKTLFAFCTTAIGIIMGATPALAFTTAGGGINGSKHDMNLWVNTGDTNVRVCVYCHTPHHAIQEGSADYLPLWSHKLTGGTTFQAYQSATLKAGIINDPLQGPSRLCMSCHDGVIALEDHSNTTGSTVRTGDSWGQVAVGAGKGIAGNLSDTHPIGFSYASAAAANRHIKGPNTPFTDNPKGLKIQDTLSDGIMTCTTCHDVHNKDNVADAANSYNYFLYSPEGGSRICLSCHDK